jgi:hypothetical protein
VWSRRPAHANGVTGNQYAQLVAQGKFQPGIDSAAREYLIYETGRFNFDNLEDPVPASVYFDARSADCWGEQTHCQTITDDSYRPPIVIQGTFWQSIWQSRFTDAWKSKRIFTCLAPQLVDPPIALRPIYSPQEVPEVPVPPILTPPSQPQPTSTQGLLSPGHVPGSPIPKSTSRGRHRRPFLGLGDSYNGDTNQHGGNRRIGSNINNHRSSPSPGYTKSNDRDGNPGNMDDKEQDDDTANYHQNSQSYELSGSGSTKVPALFTGGATGWRSHRELKGSKYVALILVLVLVEV